MCHPKKEVAIDTDFFQKFTLNLTTDELFLKFMEDFSYMPVMHNYVYLEELHECPLVKKLVNCGSLKIYDYKDFITELNEDEYKHKFENAYNIFNYSDFSPPKSSDHFNYRKAEESLGEIRTSLMAWYLGIAIFMSDDGQAKQFVSSKLSSRRKVMEVHNVKDALLDWGNLQNRSVKYAQIKPVIKNHLAPNKQPEVIAVWHT